MNPVEEALLQLDAATQASDLARLRLDEKIRDAFPEEQAALAHAQHLVSKHTEDLQEAIGAYGALRAGESKVGFASFSPRSTRRYAEPAAWRSALEKAGLGAYLPAVLTEAVNTKAVEELCAKSGQFHQAVEPLIIEKLSAPVLQWRVYRAKQP